MIISGQHPMKDEKSKYILHWIQEISKIRPELGNFSICPYASGANFSIQEQKLHQIVPNRDFDQIDASTSEMPDEHKSFNLIELRNGQYCLYPNNRCRIFDTSMTPQDVKIPDFKVSTRIFEVENDVNWGRLGDCDDYFWTTPDERREE